MKISLRLIKTQTTRQEQQKMTGK